MTEISSLERQSGTTEIAIRESPGNKVGIILQRPDREYRYRPEARVERASRKEKALLKEGLRLPGGGLSLLLTHLSKFPVNREIYSVFLHPFGAS